MAMNTNRCAKSVLTPAGRRSAPLTAALCIIALAAACVTDRGIEIECECDCHADPVCDSAWDMLDVYAIMDVAHRGADSIIDPNPACPYLDTDINCDGVTNVQDVCRMVNVVSRGSDPAAEICNPCP